MCKVMPDVKPYFLNSLFIAEYICTHLVDFPPFFDILFISVNHSPAKTVCTLKGKNLHPRGAKNTLTKLKTAVSSFLGELASVCQLCLIIDPHI